VVPVFNEFRKRFPTAAMLAAAGEGATKDLTTRLGLHHRGPLLLNLAREVARQGGIPPDDMKALIAFVGIGMYTAAAWLSLHRRKRAPIVDANVARWLSRMTGLPYNRDPRHVRWVQNLAETLTPLRTFRDYNYAVLDFSIGICTPRAPKCINCPVRKDCHFYLRSTRGTVWAPTRPRKPKRPAVGDGR